MLDSFDVIVTDPPYGQNTKVNTFHANGTRDKAVVQRNGKFLTVRPNIHSPIAGDDEPFDQEHLTGGLRPDAEENSGSSDPITPLRGRIVCAQPSTGTPFYRRR